MSGEVRPELSPREILNLYLEEARGILEEVVPSRTLLDVLTQKQRKREKRQERTIIIGESIVGEVFLGDPLGSRWLRLTKQALSIHVDDLAVLGMKAVLLYSREGLETTGETNLTYMTGALAAEILRELVIEANGFPPQAVANAQEEASKLKSLGLINFSLELGTSIEGKFADFNFANQPLV